MLISLLIFLCCGAIVGVLAGLLGVGGGTVIVPMLLAVFPYDGVPAQYCQQLALGTSLASIMFTSVASARAHHKRGAVNWDIFMRITPGILVGTFAGGLIATHLPTMFLKIFFICFLIAISCQMFAAIGFPIAVAGALGYIVGGWGRPDLPPMTLGFVHLWALLGIAGASWITAPLGVRLSHALPTKKLKRVFAVFLLFVALKMAWDLI